uniref:Protein kinase domain-containing protein n=1 Tax=Neobodo designis TaxID=312471 RepID=A0A7S1MJW8_NEODS|mmetsp:Transcript_4199/g.13387  ORF Transcript_4199/g.13387 Transcript_4199/m.13387 type:complete len:600 (+) Transcript_4199:74-1873(+)
MSSPASPTIPIDGPTMDALMALMRLIAAGVTDDDAINDALGGVLGADSDSPQPAGTSPVSSAALGRSPTGETPSVSPFDAVVPLPADVPDVTDTDDGGSVPTEATNTDGQPMGLSPLEFAVLRQNSHVVTGLLKAGASVDYIGGFSCTALCKCCYSFHKNVDLIRILLAAGANPDATTNNDTHSASCLIISVVKNNVEAVKALLEYGADVSYEWKGSNALAMALDFKKLDIAQLFENFEYRKAQKNRWERYQNQRRRDAEDREAKLDALRSRSAAPTGESPTPQPVDGRSTPTGRDETRSPSHAAGGGTGSPRSVRETAQLTENLGAMDWLVPLSDIEWGQQISAGAHGQVFRVTLKSTGDIVALKRFPCHDARSREGFRREVELLTKFRHENIVMFKGAVIDADVSAMLTELCTESLFDRLERTSAPIPWPVRLRWARDIAKGMTYLHTRTPAVVHRDLKSMNVLLDGSGTVKLCDFGIARLREHTFVMTQHIAGSPSWMAPEVLRGDDFGPASDVYSFGVVLWELLMRQVPWPNKNMAQLVGLVGFAGSTLELPDRAPEGCPPQFIDIIRSCFAKPEDRPSFRSLREQLDSLLVDVD